MSDKSSDSASPTNAAKVTNSADAAKSRAESATSMWEPESKVPPVADIVYGEQGEARGPLEPRIAGKEMAAGVTVEPVAVLVCHGMGQQVRFETIGTLAKSLMSDPDVRQGSVATTIRMVRESGEAEKDDLLSRAEITWQDQKGSRHEAHLYEAYWAPLTEGKVTYLDTLKFLFVDAAWPGIRRSRFFRTCTFQRWMFGAPKDAEIGRWTRISLMVLWLVLSALVLLIALVLMRLAIEIKQIGTGYTAIKQIALILFPGACDWYTTAHWWVILRVLLWWLAVATVFFARYFLIQYVGDVAAYTSAYKDSKFEELRHTIQKVGLDVAKVIYGFTKNPVEPVPHYRRVVLVGHSLGSVLAYDTLNAAVNLDNTCAADCKRDVVGRTHALITFGSPLDKTAFLFRNQANKLTDPLREQMAAASQPLIVDYDKYRKPLRWTNLWSRADVISGSLEYYDDFGPWPDYRDLPGDEAYADRHVVNVRDAQASTFLKAHLQYWDGALLAKTLYREITR